MLWCFRWMFKFSHVFIFSSDKNLGRELTLSAHAKLLNLTESEQYLDLVFEFCLFEAMLKPFRNCNRRPKLDFRRNVAATFSCCFSGVCKITCLPLQSHLRRYFHVMFNVLPWDLFGLLHFLFRAKHKPRKRNCSLWKGSGRDTTPRVM